MVMAPILSVILLCRVAEGIAFTGLEQRPDLVERQPCRNQTCPVSPSD